MFDPNDPDFVRNPYPYFRELREQDPVHFSPKGFWVITRYSDVAPLLRDTRLSNRPAPFALVNERNRQRYTAADVANNLISFMDPPDHANPRRIVATCMADIMRNRQDLVVSMANSLLTKIDRKKKVELLEDYCRPFALQCICRLVGVDKKHDQQVARWSNLLLYLFHAIPSMEVLNQVNEGLDAFRSHIRSLVEQRTRAPKDDLISRLIEARHGDYSLSVDLIVDHVMLIIADGIDNVAAGLASAILVLSEHPDQLETITGKPPAQFGKAVDEAIRYMTPAQYQGRIAAADIEVDGKLIRANSIVLLALASANRDPDALSDPDSFNIDREPFRHVAFGMGRHACVGGALVSMELQTALACLFNGKRQVRVETDEVEWVARAGHRWPSAVNAEISSATPQRFRMKLPRIFAKNLREFLGL